MTYLDDFNTFQKENILEKNYSKDEAYLIYAD